MKAVDIMTSLTAVKTRQTSRQLKQHREISDILSNTTKFPTAKTVYSVILDSRSNTANQHFISFTSALTQFFLFTLKTALSVSYTFDEMVGILRQCSESGTFFEICIFFQNLRILFPRFPEISEIDSTDHFR